LGGELELLPVQIQIPGPELEELGGLGELDGLGELLKMSSQ
jgi:hypothetical protein